MSICETIREKVTQYCIDAKKMYYGLGISALLMPPVFGCAAQQAEVKGNAAETEITIKLTLQEREQFKDFSFACNLCREHLADWCNKNGVTKEQAIAVINENSMHERINNTLRKDFEKGPEDTHDAKRMIDARNTKHNQLHQMRNAGVMDSRTTTVRNGNTVTTTTTRSGTGQFVGGELVDPVKGPNARQRAIMNAAEQMRSDADEGRKIIDEQQFRRDAEEGRRIIDRVAEEMISPTPTKPSSTRARTAADLTNF